MSINSLSKAEPASPTSPLAVLQSILSNPTDLQFVKQFTTDDFIYVSLNYEHPELKRIMPWAGTNEGTKGWFRPSSMSDVTGRRITSRFRILSKTATAQRSSARLPTHQRFLVKR
ncbi:hypothetical protein C241_16033 [Bradyrhizobium lupini HPC(L)]|uniref:Uncharacterized protein n=1 Tax=Bradyrhizobium lupini HPC(L) TaxID=1229491 RepID=A0ABP2RRN9_RHILU|nr:hypothetical protein C241_16033 [Bradyrhizobium lupini HPC(L)]